MPARVASSRFVGREPELAELRELFDAAVDERAHLAFVTGESGMGKTRLVNELAEQVEEAGGRVLSGDCVELGESELPYAPIVSALRPMARRRDPVLDELGSGRAQLAQLLPELGDTPQKGSDDTAQARLFEVLLALLERLGRDHPVLLVVEDIHWADRSTRDFLVFLSRVVCRERVLVVATYRTDELHRRHPLKPVMAELERTERARRIPLSPFTRDELVLQLEDILGTEADAALVDRLLTRSEGNPLYAEELIAAGGDGRAELPTTLRDALMVRVEALGEPAQELLRVVAAGRRLDHDVLRDASGLDGRELREALREAVGQQLLEPDEDGRYAFRHALLREAVRDDLLPGERSDLHRSLAEALERLGSKDLEVLTEAAHHWHEADCRENALAGAIRAATAAEHVHAMGEAADLLERALDLWNHVPNAEELVGSDHVDLLRRAADAHKIAGDHPRMASVLKSAIHEVDRDAEPYRAAAILERLGKARWDMGKGKEALATYEEGLALLPPGPSKERAILLAAQGSGAMLSGRYDESIERCREALAVAREVGWRPAEDLALNTLGVCLAHTGDMAGGEEALRASMQIGREDGRVDDLARAYVNLSESVFLEGRPREGQAIAHAGLEELAETRSCTWLSLQLAEYDFHVGDWEDADKHARLEGQRVFGMALVQRQIRLAELTLGRGDVQEAIRLLEDARDRARWSIEPQWHGPIAALLAQAYRRERRYEEARAAIQAGLERVPPGKTLAIGRLARIGSAGVATEADIAEQARALGHTEEAEDAVRRAKLLLDVTRGAAEQQRGEGLAMTHGHVADAEAEVLRAEGRPDATAYAAAAERWDGLERVYTAALARRRQAEVLAAEGDREAAAEAASRSRASAVTLGAEWLVAEIDGLVRRARLPVAGADEATEPEPEPVQNELGLTPRERDVLLLLAEGATNREIGERLFMAEKTASVHVSRILAKLDVRSRTEAAAVAHRLGMTV